MDDDMMGVRESRRVPCLQLSKDKCAFEVRLVTLIETQLEKGSIQ